MTDFPPPPSFPPPPAGPNSSGQQSDKEWLVAVLLSWFVGMLGIDRFYLGYTGLGIAKLLTFGGCGV
ncbi:MAG: TM2 domain-containing protein, partial [Actinobacteria bacterium]|nr:TM2 domain-containing protein [Actinomycetota bacterium]